LTPLSKKGIDWNPLGQIPNLQPPSFVYMIDEDKMNAKKLELQLRKAECDDKVKEFKIVKEKQDLIRTKFIEKMNKVDGVISQKV
jgi:hypothetical protein